MMTKRKPLDLLQEWLVSQYWAQQKPPLKRASYAVLMRLLDRQSPKTGRCDPSAVGLAEEIGFTERSVRSAFNELEERGAVKRYRKSRQARNQYLIFSTIELGRNARIEALKLWSAHRTGKKSASPQHETHCRVDLKRPSPETIKETKKKKENAKSGTAFGSTSCAERNGGASNEMGLAEFEKRVAKVFERGGFGYVGLLELPAQYLEDAHAQMKSGEISFSNAASQLLDEFRKRKC